MTTRGLGIPGADFVCADPNGHFGSQAENRAEHHLHMCVCHYLRNKSHVIKTGLLAGDPHSWQGRWPDEGGHPQSRRRCATDQVS